MKKLFSLIALVALFAMTACNNQPTVTVEEQQQEQQIVEDVELITIFDEPERIQCSSTYEVFQTLSEHSGLATSDSGYIDLVRLNINDTCFDQLRISESENAKFMMIGTYRYRSEDSVIRTIPILQLFEIEVE